VILAKTNRVERIYMSTDLESKIVSDGQLLRTVAALLLVATALLVVNTAISSFALIEGSGPTAGMLVGTCASLTSAVYILALCFVGTLMAYAALLAYRTRDLPSNFNESAHILNALVVLILFCCIILPLDYVLAGVPNALAITHGVGQSLLALLLTAIIFLPKAHLLYLESVYLLTPIQKRSVGFSIGGEEDSVYSLEAPRRTEGGKGQQYAPESKAPAAASPQVVDQRMLDRVALPSESLEYPSTDGSALYPSRVDRISVGVPASALGSAVESRSGLTPLMSLGGERSVLTSEAPPPKTSAPARRSAQWQPPRGAPSNVALIAPMRVIVHSSAENTSEGDHHTPGAHSSA
jgi:hypothetical protein